MRCKSLLIDTGDYSLSRWELSGIGLRAAELADTLSSTCHVRVCAPDHDGDLVPVGSAEVVDPEDWAAALRDTDAVMFFDRPHRGRLESAALEGKLIVSENTAPIEHAEYPSIVHCVDPAATYRKLVEDYRRQLELSHHFLCRSRVERATLVANLCVMGMFGPADIARSRTLEHLLSLAPIGYSARSAAAARTAVPRHLADFLWTGGIWSFYDPVLVVRALALCRDQGTRLTLGFLHVTPQPDNEALLQTLHQEALDHNLVDQVRFHTKPLAHEDRDQYLLAAKGLVCIARPGVENQTCVRLRVRDSRLFELPMVVDGCGATAVEAASDPRTVVLDEPTANGLAAVLLKLADSRSQRPRQYNDEYCYEQGLRGFTTWLTTTLR